jgi:hypothetical protein
MQAAAGTLKKNRHALPKDANQALEILQKRKERLEALDPEKREKKEDKERWEKVLLKAEGEKVRDDETRLKKMAKRQEREKRKSAKAWCVVDDAFTLCELEMARLTRWCFPTTQVGPQGDGRKDHLGQGGEAECQPRGAQAGRQGQEDGRQEEQDGRRWGRQEDLDHEWQGAEQGPTWL